MDENILLLKALVGLGGSGLIIFLTQIFKPFIPETKWYPIIAIGWGLLINIAIAWVIKPPVTGISLLVAIILGIMAGGASGGWYSGGSTMKEGPESNKNNRPVTASTTFSGENQPPPG